MNYHECWLVALSVSPIESRLSNFYNLTAVLKVIECFNVSKFIIGGVCVWKAWGEIRRRTVNVCKYGVVHFYWQQLSLISWTPRVNKPLHSSLSLQKARSEMAPSWQTRWKIVGLFLYGLCLNCRFLFRQKSEVKFQASLAAQGKRKIKKVKLR